MYSWCNVCGCYSCDITNCMAVPWHKISCSDIFPRFCVVSVRCSWSARWTSVRPVRLHSLYMYYRSLKLENLQSVRIPCTSLPPHPLLPIPSHPPLPSMPRSGPLKSSYGICGSAVSFLSGVQGRASFPTAFWAQETHLLHDFKVFFSKQKK